MQGGSTQRNYYDTVKNINLLYITCYLYNDPKFPTLKKNVGNYHVWQIGN